VHRGRLKIKQMMNLLISYNRFNNGYSVLYIQSERFDFNKKIYFKKRKENKEKYINIKF